MRWLTYASANHALFRGTIARSYVQSLDCPALNGRRNMDDVIAGHQASGEFDARLWRLLCVPPLIAGDDPEPLGVLLLARVPQAQVLELVYLGLTPEARGRRLGDLLVRQAIASVNDSGMARLSLAVDAKNAPALRLYYRHGLIRSGSRLAMMRDLRPPAVAALPMFDAPAASAEPATGSFEEMPYVPATPSRKQIDETDEVDEKRADPQ